MTSCPVCGGNDLAPSWTVNGYGLSRCARCTHLFVATGVAPGALDDAYERDYYIGDGSTRTGYEDYLANAPQRMRGFVQRLRELERYTAGRGRLLDFGCAVGLFVKVAADAGWDAIGLERSAWAADYGRKHFGLTIVSGNGDEGAAFTGQFDMVTMWDVLEHLENPRGVVGRAAEWVRPGGILALNTVDSAAFGARIAGVHWRHLAPPHHLQFFTRESLMHLLQACGFRLLSVHSRGVMWGADRRRKQLDSLRAFSEAVATHWHVRSLANALHLLDEVDIVAVREGAASNA